MKYAAPIIIVLVSSWFIFQRRPLEKETDKLLLLIKVQNDLYTSLKSSYEKNIHYLDSLKYSPGYSHRFSYIDSISSVRKQKLKFFLSRLESLHSNKKEMEKSAKNLKDQIKKLEEERKDALIDLALDLVLSKGH